MNSTVGKYVPGNSIVHNTNPIVKLMANLIMIVLIFLTDSFIINGVILVITLSIFFLSRLRTIQLLKMLYTALFIGVFLLVINLFLIGDGYSSELAAGGKYRVDYHNAGNGFFFQSVSYWKFKITDRGVFQALFITLRVYIMIVLTTLLTSTTKSTALTKGIEVLLYPLKLVFVPIHIIAMIISIALRFIPTLLEETQRIMKAQASRGVDFKNGNLKTKSKAMVTLIIPLFVSAFSKAEDLGNAMETRGYDPYEKRTRYRAYPLRVHDIILGLFVTGLLILSILIKNGTVFELPFWWI